MGSEHEIRQSLLSSGSKNSHQLIDPDLKKTVQIQL